MLKELQGEGEELIISDDRWKNTTRKGKKEIIIVPKMEKKI